MIPCLSNWFSVIIVGTSFACVVTQKWENIMNHYNCYGIFVPFMWWAWNIIYEYFKPRRPFIPEALFNTYTKWMLYVSQIRLAAIQIDSYTTCGPTSLQWRHNERAGVSNHRRLDRLLNRLFRRGSKKISKLRVTGFREGNSSVTGQFPAQRSNNAENVSIWWLYHAGFKI